MLLYRNLLTLTARIRFGALLLPSLQDHIALVAAAFGMASVALNILGVKEGAAVQIVGSLLKFLFLCGIVVRLARPPQSQKNTI